MEFSKTLAQKHAQLMLDAECFIWKNPETGYKEWKTHEYLETAFAKLGYELTLAGDIPGFTAEIDTGKPGPKIAVFGELDSVICATHPESDPETGAVHACGHNCQAAALLGLAAMLKEPGALDGMCGKILLVAVPAEELLELEYREELRKKGVIKYFGGKPEFMWRGLLDGVDMSFMIHTDGYGQRSISGISRGSNGCLLKNIRFEGKASHAGGSPHRGINALYAANLALSAINALRETFQDNSHIRVHPIITKGGDIVNAIPDTVTMECYVRGATMDDIVMVNKKVNRALAASAAAMGAKVHLRDIPGYYTRYYPPKACELMKTAMEKVTDEVKITDGWATGCSDMGDVGAVMPALHPWISGAVGSFHGNDMYIVNPQAAVVQSAQLQYEFLHTFLDNDAAGAKEVIADYKPDFDSFQAYFDFADSLNLDIDAVCHEDGKTTLTYSTTSEEKAAEPTDAPL